MDACMLMRMSIQKCILANILISHSIHVAGQSERVKWKLMKYTVEWFSIELISKIRAGVVFILLCIADQNFQIKKLSIYWILYAKVFYAGRKIAFRYNYEFTLFMKFDMEKIFVHADGIWFIIKSYDVSLVRLWSITVRLSICVIDCVHGVFLTPISLTLFTQ